MSTKAFPLRHPYIFAVLLLITILAAGVLASIVTEIANQSLSVHWGSMNGALALIGAVLLTRLGWWRCVGFRRSKRPGFHFLLWLPLCAILVWNLSQIQFTELVDPGRMLLWLGLTALGAFVEEVFYRGLMLRALKSRGIWKAAIVSALLFGSTHVINGLFGFDWGIVAGQTAYAMAIGFAYAAYVLRTGLLWPVILVHALANFADLIDQEVLVGSDSPGEADLIRWLIYVVLFTVYGIWMLKRTTSRTDPAEAGLLDPSLLAESSSANDCLFTEF
jgi:membrane protease YdiL (CAAX protease family)